MNKKKARKIGFLTFWLPLLFGILTTSVVVSTVNYQNEYEVKSYTDDLANKAESLIAERFKHYEYGLRGLRGAIVSVGVDNITRKQFENYSHSRDIEHEFPGALGFGFIRRVPLAEEASFIARTREDGTPNFSIRALAPHDTDRFVIQYIYPTYKNKQAIGLDIGSEANRRSAALLSARKDVPYLTAPITLVQANKKPRKGALVLLPIYSDNVVLNTMEARESAVMGWSYAPLVIDEVLANLDSLTDQSYVSLTNLTESEPFYRSKDTETLGSLEDKVVRNIYVLGQHWKMELVPSIQDVNQVKPWAVSWFVVFGLGLTLLTLFIINLLGINGEKEESYTDSYQLSFRSLLVFLSRTRVKRSFKFALLLSFLMLFGVGWLIVQSHFIEVSDSLSKTKGAALSSLNKDATSYRRDTLYLANTPAIVALEKLQTEDIQSGKTVAALSLWNERLADIFKAYMLPNKDVHQVRFIEASNGWYERVKVQRIGEDLRAFSGEELQSKESETYIAQTLQAGIDRVFQSDINLNRKLGKIEQPGRPIWRFSTPLFHTDGSVFGIIIINVSAENILKTTAEHVVKDTDLYITNKNGDYLLHPNASKAFTFEYGNPHRWQDEFTSASLFYGLNAFDLMSFKGQNGSVFAEQGRFSLGNSDDDRVLNVYSTTSQFSLFKKVAIDIGYVIAVLFSVIFIGFTVQYWIWLSGKIRHKDALNAQLENQKNKEMMRFKGLLESAPDATFVVDEYDIIQMVNAQVEKIFGYDRFELEGQCIQKLLPEYSKKVSESRILEEYQGDQAIVLGRDEKLFALGSNGIQFPAEISLSAVRLDEKILVSASVRNISERLAIEEKLRAALRDAELATEAKSAFLANTSHEIRTPLNAIIGLSYLLSEDQLTDAQHQLVSKIQVSGKSLLGIVNDVLDLSKIEANEMELETQSVELRELCEEVSSLFAIQAEAKSVEFNVELDSKLPSWVIADSVRLRQIMVNLLSNSLKFTSAGKVSISAEVITSEQTLPGDLVNVRLTVIDTGIGISSDAQSRLFKPFTQADSSTTRRFGGTGLGLSIVYQLVQLMGGKISVESREGFGSKFWVDLPLKTQTLEEIAAQENQNQTLFVFIAEDDPVDAEQLKQIARSLGWRSEVVGSSEDLVKAYITRQNNKLRAPDAIIVDHQIPSKGGFSAISHLVATIGREHLPAVLMLSSHNKDSMASKDSEHLINHFLLKPITSTTLFSAMNNIVPLNAGNSKRVQPSSSVEAAGVKLLLGIRLLVVDDSATNLLVVSRILEHNGAVVQTANSGEEALTQLNDSSNNFDAVLMDVQMPGIDGLETTSRVRNDLGLTLLPIIALTAGALVEEKNRALEAGMNDFLTKPINPAKLINVVSTWVEGYRGKDV